MIPWLTPLRAALDAEFATKPRLATLASVDLDHRPRARMIVVRSLEDDGSLWITSDTRSEKATQFTHHSYAEIVFWLARRREQYRLAGPIEIARAPDDPRRLTAWRQMSDSARALFSWPAPGFPRALDEAAFPERISVETPVPETLDLLILRPDRVEHLELDVHPHRRTRWNAETAWVAQTINP